MEYGLRIVFIALCLLSLSIKNGVSCQKVDELGEMRSMLRSALEQNRKLERQNNRLKLIWAGLQQMCSALQMAPCDCGSARINETNETNETKIDKTDTSVVETPKQILRLVSIISGGYINNSVDVSVSYVAPLEHSSQWLILRMNNGMLRTSGKRTSKPSNGNGAMVREYTSSFTIDNINKARLALVRVNSETKSFTLRLNLTALEEPGTQVISNIGSNIMKFNDSYQVEKESDLNITSEMTINIRFEGNITYYDDQVSRTDVYFTGLNTSVYPATSFQIVQFNNDGLGISISGQNNSPVLQITLRYSFAQYGGILTVRFPRRIKGYVEEYSNGDLIKILSVQTNTVVAPNSLGMFILPKQMLVYPPSQSIICSAMGNPRPEVYILKKSQNGVPSEMPSETLIMDSVSNMKAYTVYAADKKQSSGKYICRAVSGNKTVDVMTEVVITEPITFDELRTGVIKNTTEKIVIACRASGRPRPILELRLKEQHGPNLLKYGVYKVYKTESNQTTSRVTLTIPANETKVNTVYCMATYNYRYRGPGEFRKIEVYPGKEDNWKFYDMVSRKVNSM